MISDQTYLNWQKKIRGNSSFRRFCAFWGIYSVLFFYAIGVYLLVIHKWRVVFLALAALVLARLIFSPIVYVFYQRQRPYQKLNFIPIHAGWLFSGITTRHNSFPSDHAASFASIALVLCYFFPPFLIALILWVIINGIARIILGYHYPIDVLAGWLVGILSGIITLYAARLFW